MNVESFLSHHGIRENPFNAEEARHDPVFARLDPAVASHPDLAKILGHLDRPATSIVFGEKGSGKTAIRLTVGDRVKDHNERSPQRRVLLIPYDDLNPFLDRLYQRSGGKLDETLRRLRLADHQDAILSLAVTQVVDALLEGNGSTAARDLRKQARKAPRRQRADLAVIAGLYDQPRGGSVVSRYRQLAKALKLGPRFGAPGLKVLGIVLTVVALVALVGVLAARPEPMWLYYSGVALVGGAALLAWGAFALRQVRGYLRFRHVARDTPAVSRSTGELMATLGQLHPADLEHQPLPGAPGSSRGGDGPALDSDSRYHLTRKLLDAIEPLGFHALMVLMDRVDEPTLISGDPGRMRAVVWPLLDNKFLQQERVAVILLLPAELRYLLARESGDFYQHARLDKQHLIDRLTWSGATLYDLCSARLQACRTADPQAIGLTDLFEEGVTKDLIIDALDQMHQPRDAFKFMYAVIQEHCRTVPQDQPVFRIPRLTLETIRRAQSQRVQELARGLSPA